MSGYSNYVEFFKAALRENLAGMAGLDCTVGETRPQQETFSSKGLAVIVGIAGKRQGLVVLDIGKESARRLCELIDGESYSLEDEFVLHTLTEFANIVTGHAVTLLNDAHKDLHLEMTPPSLFLGNELKITGYRIKTEFFEADTPVGKMTVTIGFKGGRSGGC
jgi:CheY-specific phosphatase CheX